MKTKSVKKCNCMCHDTGDRSDAYCRHCKSAKWIKNFTKPPIYQDKSFMERKLKELSKILGHSHWQVCDCDLGQTGLHHCPVDVFYVKLKSFIKSALHQQYETAYQDCAKRFRVREQGIIEEIKKRLPKKKNQKGRIRKYFCEKCQISRPINCYMTDNEWKKHKHLNDEHNQVLDQVIKILDEI